MFMPIVGLTRDSRDQFRLDFKLITIATIHFALIQIISTLGHKETM